MKGFLVGLGVLSLCIAFTACEINMSPTATTAGRDMTAPSDDVHEQLGPGESCGTAAERSGCHTGTVTIGK